MAATLQPVKGSGYGNIYVDTVIWGGDAWDPASGAITYYFGNQAGPAAAWTSAEQSAFQNAVALYESFTDLQFAQVFSADAANLVWLKEPASFWGYDGTLGESEVPADGFPQLHSWFNYQDATWNNLAQGSDGFVTVIHEMGHSLGLAHPHDGGDQPDATIFPGVTGPFSTGTYGLNQGIWTEESYNDGWNNAPPRSINYGFEGTPMAFDIAALQALYGANLAYHAGDDVYQLPSINAQGTFWSCIWDAGGDDTISNAGSSLTCTINLNAATLQDNDPNAGGFISRDAGIVGGFTIANGVVIENAIGGSGADTLIGNSADNQLTGGAGNDTIRALGGNDYIDGGAGADAMIGGTGDDTYIVDSTSDKVIENPDEGTDTIGSSVTYTLSSNVDNLTLTGTTAINETGNALANMIIGNSGNNILAGLGGADALDGGDGIDTATYAASFAGVDVSLQTGTGTGGDAEGDTLVRIENLTGSQFNDTLEGDSGNNVLKGGNGTDTVSYEHATTGIVVNLAITSEQNTVGAGIDTLSSFENLSGSQFDDVLVGSNGTNVLIGFDSNDVLNGAGGSDTMLGGNGNDAYTVDNTRDVADETACNGIDTVNASVTFSFTDALHAKGDIENLNLTGTGNINGTGNALDNVITGNGGNNVLAGLAGADVLDGGGRIDTVTYAASSAGVNVSLMTQTGSGGDAQGDTLVSIEKLMGSPFDDTLEGDAGANVLNGGSGIDTVSYEHATAGVTVNLASTSAQNTVGAGSDTLSGFENLTGSQFDDILIGTNDANTIMGGAGNDRITGVGGADILTGGANADTFVFKTVTDSTPAVSDVITDFAAGEDKIDLSAIDANTALSGNQAFLFGGENTNVVANSVTWFEDAANGNTIVQADVNGDMTADLKIVLHGTGVNLHATDFVL